MALIFYFKIVSIYYTDKYFQNNDRKIKIMDEISITENNHNIAVAGTTKNMDSVTAVTVNLEMTSGRPSRSDLCYHVDELEKHQKGYKTLRD